MQTTVTRATRRLRPASHPAGSKPSISCRFWPFTNFDQNAIEQSFYYVHDLSSSSCTSLSPSFAGLVFFFFYVCFGLMNSKQNVMEMEISQGHLGTPLPVSCPRPAGEGGRRG